MQLNDFCSDLPKPARKAEAAQESTVRFYDLVNSLFTKRLVRHTGFSPKAVLRAVSMDRSLFWGCTVLSKYVYLDKDLFFNLLRGVLPKRNKGFGFFKYIKEPKLEVAYDLIKLIANHFHVKTTEVPTVVQILSHENIQIDDIETFFGFEKK